MIIEKESLVTMSIRARCAFVLLVADILMSDVSVDSEGYTFAQKSLDVASEWLDGKTVSGDELNDLLMDQRDEGLYAFVSSTQKRLTDIAYNVLGAAICYIAWHAYRTQNAFIPSGIDGVNEDYVQWLINEAKRSSLFEEEKVVNIYSYLLKNFSVQSSDELGRPIEFNTLKRKIFVVI